MKAFIESQINYCPLIWMFGSRTMDNKINRIHDIALRLVYSITALTLINYSRRMDCSQSTTGISKRLQVF